MEKGGRRSGCKGPRFALIKRLIDHNAHRRTGGTDLLNLRTVVVAEYRANQRIVVAAAGLAIGGAVVVVKLKIDKGVVAGIVDLHRMGQVLLQDDVLERIAGTAVRHFKGCSGMGGGLRALNTVDL